MKRLTALLAVVAACLAVVAEPAAATHRADTTVTDWNRTLLGILRTPGAQPATVHPTRSLAIVHSAIYDAVASAPFFASRHAAANAAAHDTLVALFPAQRGVVDERYADLLADLGDGFRVRLGVALGRHFAARVLASRADDGSGATPPPFVPTTRPGDYRLTPPSFPNPVFTHWGSVRPFVLRSGDELRPPAPPALTSRAYAAATNEVKALGVATGSARTAEQTQIGQFWTAPIQNHWNEIAQTVTLQRRAGLVRTARMFAELNVAFADSAIAFYDAKYAHRFWRPITAIRAANTDGNPATSADPAWTPLATTPADPAYPGAHSVVSAAAARILADEFGDRFRFSVSSEVLPGVTRSFRSLSAAAEEAGISRIYAGVHTRLDHDSGEKLGGAVASAVLNRR